MINRVRNIWKRRGPILYYRWILFWIQSRDLKAKPGSVVRFNGFKVRVTDGANYYMQYKDLFVNQIYYFSAKRVDPVIIDGGSNIGMSILFFKSIYPYSRILGFEPDPNIYQVLRENVQCNHLIGVSLVNAGLGSKQEKKIFIQDNKSGGRINEDQQGIEVQVKKLSAYINESIDFLKLNIEGEELSVLQELVDSGKMRYVPELVLEYHGWAKGEQRLGSVLNLLDQNGFRYFVHDFDSKTSSMSKPPFRMTNKTTWFCLVYARRLA